MRLLSGAPGISQRLVWSYRGFTVVQITRSYDVRNKTNRGYDWDVSHLILSNRYTAHSRKAARSYIDALLDTQTT